MIPLPEMDSESSLSLPGQVCRNFSLAEIQFATLNFDDRLVIGRGAFGNVYKCQIYEGSVTAVVAIKRLHLLSSQGASEFWAEVQMLSKLRHCNLVSLIGYCIDEQEMILVYEYMQNGTLEDQLHKVENSLSWIKRLRICIDAARGLDYLHTGTGTQHGVVHRDIKTSNILLDENFSAKISDFGLAKISPKNQTHTFVSTGVKGTFGYLDPSYFYTGKLTRKSDVYAFGVVLLEVLCGRPAVDSTLEEEEWGLVAWAKHCIRKGNLREIIDFRLRGKISASCLKDFARTTVGCLHDNPKSRPTMAEVVIKLGFMLSQQEKNDISYENTTFIKKISSLFLCKGLMKCNDRMLEDEAGSDSEDTEEDGDMCSTVAVNNFITEQENSLKLIHFDASSFTIVDLLHAPAEPISRNNYSSLYKVFLNDGDRLVVKRVKKTFFHKQFDPEAFIFGNICHKNIMALKACCNLRNEALLIYACSQNGTVASFLKGPKTVSGWAMRMKIIVGITRGLFYLHTNEHMIHGNLTSRNVLLDKDFNPLIVDIGLSRLRIDARPDSPQNYAPELLDFQNASMETDVYSLGFIILELLTRKSTHSTMDGFSLRSWVKSVLKEGRTMELFDAEITWEANIEEELLCILHLAMSCMRSSPKARLKVDEVLRQLEEIGTTKTCKHKKSRRITRKGREKKTIKENEK